MAFLSTGIAWASPVLVRDFLRVSSDNDLVVSTIMAGIPEEVEASTGVPADEVRSMECPDAVKTLVLFMTLQRYDPEAMYVDRVVDSLTMSVQAMRLGE